MPITFWIAIADILAAAQPPLPPAAMPDMLSVARCEEAVINVLANDVDPGGHPLRIASLSGSSLGEASIVGSDSIKYFAGRKSGTDTVAYLVMNGAGATSSGLLTVNIEDAGCE